MDEFENDMEPEVQEKSIMSKADTDADVSLDSSMDLRSNAGVEQTLDPDVDILKNQSMGHEGFDRNSFIIATLGQRGREIRKDADPVAHSVLEKFRISDELQGYQRLDKDSVVLAA